jgi:Cu/Ag efflux protein CusF
MKAILLTAAVAALTGCASKPVAESRPETKTLKEEPLRRYELQGQVRRLDAQNKIATIQHEAIGDWMGPMTMDFPVKDPADLAKLKEGAPVNATVFVQGFDYWVGEVRDSEPVAVK